MRFTPFRLAPTKLTLFTKPNCGLCDNAKLSLAKALDQAKTKVEYKEVDISKPENSAWYDKYAFDIPVVHFDIEGQSKTIKLMHRIETDKVLSIVDPPK